MNRGHRCKKICEQNSSILSLTHPPNPSHMHARTHAHSLTISINYKLQTAIETEALVYLFPTMLRMERSVNWPTSAGSSVRLLDLRDKILSEASSPRSGGREKREFSSRINVSSFPRPPISPGNSCNHTRYYTAILTCVTL